MIKFMKYKWLYFLISSLVLVPGIFSLFKWGLKPSIDFTGGTLIEITNVKCQMTQEKTKLIKILEKNNLSVGSLQSSGESNCLLRLKSITKEQNDKLQSDLNKEFTKVQESRFETVGPVLGAEFLQKTLIAALVAMLGILSYVAYAFKNLKFGVSAVLALIHDLLVVIGVFAILGHFLKIEVDTLFVTAVLTTMSFSVHDTIIVFDRIRETLKNNSGLPFETIANKALTETMGRSLNNSFTLIFMLLSLLLLGGESTKWFIFALLVGTTSGAYSSPFVATPILVLWQKWEDKRKINKKLIS